jgi:hypothetical protein
LNLYHITCCRVANTPVYERLNQEAELKRQEKERLEQLRIENSLRNHTFAPQIPEASKSMISMRSFSNDGTAAGGGSVSGTGDDIFARLNAQTTIAKSPHLIDPNLNKTPTKTRSIILSEEDRNKLYERLASPPKKMSFAEKAPGGGDDDRSSVNPRKSIHQIDEVINRLHNSHTKAMKAEAFADPQPLHSMLRANSMSNGNTPNASPDKSLSRRNSMATADVPGPPLGSGSPSQPKRMMSMSMNMTPPSSLVRKSSTQQMAAGSPSSAMARTGSVKTMSPTAAASAGKSSNESSSNSLPVPPKVVPRRPSQASVVPPAPASTPAAPAPKPAAPAPKSAAAAPTVPRAATSRTSAGGDDFLAKLEASMNMLTMNPAQIVAQQQALAGTSQPAPAPTPAPAPAPTASPVPAPAPASAPAAQPEPADASPSAEPDASAHGSSHHGEYDGETDGARRGNDEQDEDEDDGEEEEEDVVNVEDEY